MGKAKQIEDLKGIIEVLEGHLNMINKAYGDIPGETLLENYKEDAKQVGKALMCLQSIIRNYPQFLREDPDEKVDIEMTTGYLVKILNGMEEISKKIKDDESKSILNKLYDKNLGMPEDVFTLIDEVLLLAEGAFEQKTKRKDIDEKISNLVSGQSAYESIESMNKYTENLKNVVSYLENEIDITKRDYNTLREKLLKRINENTLPSISGYVKSYKGQENALEHMAAIKNCLDEVEKVVFNPDEVKKVQYEVTYKAIEAFNELIKNDEGYVILGMAAKMDPNAKDIDEDTDRVQKTLSRIKKTCDKFDKYGFLFNDKLKEEMDHILEDLQKKNDAISEIFKINPMEFYSE